MTSFKEQAGVEFQEDLMQKSVNLKQDKTQKKTWYKNHNMVESTLSCIDMMAYMVLCNLEFPTDKVRRGLSMFSFNFTMLLVKINVDWAPLCSHIELLRYGGKMFVT